MPLCWVRKKSDKRSSVDISVAILKTLTEFSSFTRVNEQVEDLKQNYKIVPEAPE